MKQTSLSFSYQPALDGLRAIAVLLVMFTHCETGFAINGNIGVDVFFVLSGFLITILLMDEFQGSGNVSLRGFYIRRTFRIFPALYLLLAAITLFTLLFRQTEDLLPGMREIAASALYINNIAWSWGWDKDIFLGHTWSLACEEQFYLIWPWILLIFLRLRRTGLLTGIAAMIIASIIIGKISGSLPELGRSLLQESILSGCIAAWFFISGFRIHSGFSAIILLLILAIGLIPVDSFTRISESGGKSLIGMLTAILIISLLSHPENMTSRLLSLRPLRYTGKISYSLYLWHVPVFRLFKYHSSLAPWMTILLQFAVTMLVASLSWIILEKRLTAIGRKISDNIKKDGP